LRPRPLSITAEPLSYPCSQCFPLGFSFSESTRPHERLRRFSCSLLWPSFRHIFLSGFNYLARNQTPRFRQLARRFWSSLSRALFIKAGSLVWCFGSPPESWIINSVSSDCGSLGTLWVTRKLARIQSWGVCQVAPRKEKASCHLSRKRLKAQALPGVGSATLPERSLQL